MGVVPRLESTDQSEAQQDDAAKEMTDAAREEDNTWALTKEGDAESGSPSDNLQHSHRA